MEMIMSPPAVRKSIARVAGGMLATAAVAPRSSEMIRPVKPSELRSTWVMTIEEKAGVPNPAYDLVSVLYRDAQARNSEIADRAKRLLGSRLPT